MHIDDQVYKHRASLAWGRRTDVSLQDILDIQVPADLRTGHKQGHLAPKLL